MKKIITYSLFGLLAILNAEDILIENNENNNAIQKDDLNYLFDENNYKFPVSDYIYKAGLKKANNEKIILKNEDNEEVKNNISNILNQKLENQNLENQEIITQQKKLEEQIKLQKLKEKLNNENSRLYKEIKQDNISSKEQKLKKLIRDSILADRANTQIYFKDNSSKYGVDGFSNQKSIDISTNEHKLFRTIRAGRLIPALLTTAISSDLQGIVTAQIEQDIYASMGQAVLIPRGSKAIGFYRNDNKTGQNRLEILWREIITPQGINILLTNAIASDNMGMSGAVGSVNNKYLERYGVGYALSTLSNILLLKVASKTNGSAYAQEVYSQSKDDISTIVDDIIQQQSQIKPTIEIKSGSRIFIVPTNHMWFAKPKNGEVMTKYFED